MVREITLVGEQAECIRDLIVKRVNRAPTVTTHKALRKELRILRDILAQMEGKVVEGGAVNADIIHGSGIVPIIIDTPGRHPDDKQYICDGCPGDGRFNGQDNEKCFRCEGKGYRTPADVKRNKWNDDKQAAG